MNTNKKHENGQHDNEKNDNEKSLFDLEKYRLNPHDNAGAVFQQKQKTISKRKPIKDEWVRVRSGTEYSICVGIIELQTEMEMYLVTPAIVPTLAQESTFTQRMLFSTITRQGTFFLWPVRLPDSEGRLDTWNKSALEAAKCAQEEWCRITPNMGNSAYDVKTMTAQVPEPVWPQESFQELVSIAFQDRIIESVDHPALKRLRGEA